MCDAARRQLFGIMDLNDHNSDTDSEDGNRDGESAGGAILAIPIDDPTAFLAACKEEVPPECDPDQMSKLSQLANFSDEEIAALWSKYDADQSGVLEKSEADKFLIDCVMGFGEKLDVKDPKNKEVLDRLFYSMDTDGSNTISWDEFYLFFQAQKDVAFLQQFAGSKKEFTTEQLYAMWANYDADQSGELEADEVLKLLCDVTQTDANSLKNSKNKNKLTSFLKNGQKVTWDVFFQSFVPIIQQAVKNAKK
jgi:Ca2+-binding EF-hand superfamily protein